MWVQSGCRLWLCLPAFWSVHRGRSAGFRTCQRWLWSSGGVFPAFCPLSRFVFVVLLANMALFRVLGGFSGFYGVDVYLYELMSLRGLWGFCVREWLGGLKTFCVFAFLFLSLCSCFCSSLSCFCLSFCFPCLSSCSLLVLSLSLWLVLGFFRWGCCFFFPFGYMQKERAQRFVPCVLACPAVDCISLVPCALLLAF